MADRNPAENPDPDPGVGPLDILSRYQDQVARFTMPPADYNRYDQILRNFLGQVNPHEEFQRQMGLLLGSPRYRHLQIYYNSVGRRFYDHAVGHRRITRKELEEGGPLFIYPLVIFVLYEEFISYAQLSQPLWHDCAPGDDISERVRALNALWASEWSRFRNQRYTFGSYVAREDPAVSDPDGNLNPEVFFMAFLHWCQEQVARMTMSPEDFRLYERLTFDYAYEHITYARFRDEMLQLLRRKPIYNVLGSWWNAVHMHINGGTPLGQNPSLTYPLHVCVNSNITRYRELFRYHFRSS